MNEDNNQTNKEELETESSQAQSSAKKYDLTLAGVLNNGLNIGGTNFLQILVISLTPLLAALPLIAAIFATALFSNENNTVVFGIGVVVSLVLLVATLYLLILAQTTLAIGLIHLIRSDQTKLNMKEAWRLGRKHVWTFFIASLVFALLTVLGFILLIIPGLIVLVLFYFTPYVAIDEERGIKPAFKRARNIMRGNVVTLLVVFLIIFAVSGAVSWIPFASLLIAPFEAAIFAYMYVAFSENTPRHIDSA